MSSNGLTPEGAGFVTVLESLPMERLAQLAREANIQGKNDLASIINYFSVQLLYRNLNDTDHQGVQSELARASEKTPLWFFNLLVNSGYPAFEQYMSNGHSS